MSDIQGNAEGKTRTKAKAWHSYAELRSTFRSALHSPKQLAAIGVLVILIGFVSVVTVLYLQTFFHFRSGTRELERHHNAEALAHFQAYQRVWPNDPQALLLSARAAWRLQEFEQAENYLQKYQKAGGPVEDFNRESLMAAAARGEIDRAVKYFKDQQQRSDAATPLILEALVSGSLRQNRIPEGTTFLQYWLDLQPNDTQALSVQASLDGQRRSPHDAIAKYRRVLQLDPDLETAQLPLAELLVETRQYEEAFSLLDRLRQRQPKNWQVALLLVRCQDFLGQKEAADRLLDQVLAQAPDLVAALIARGQLDLQNGKLTAAETSLRRALAREPGNYQVNYLLADCLLQLGKTEEMHVQLQRLKQLGDDQKRLMVLTQEIRFNPRDSSLPREMAMILLRGGNVEGGFQCLMNALREDPQSAQLRQALAEYQQKVGNMGLSVSRRPTAPPVQKADMPMRR